MFNCTRIHRLRQAFAALAALLVASSASATLLLNGGFEAPNINANPEFGVGSTVMPGWTVVGGNVMLIDNAAFGGLGVNSSEGQQFVDLTGDVGRGGGVRADAVTTVAGQQYRLQFDLGAFFVASLGAFGDVTVDLWINNAQQASFTNVLSLSSAGSDWQTMTFDFAAAGGLTTIEIRSSLLTTSSALGVGLDNVQLTSFGNAGSAGSALPLPSGLVLAALALAALASTVARQRR
jgi:Protein of unknown function (DUF642)